MTEFATGGRIEAGSEYLIPTGCDYIIYNAFLQRTEHEQMLKWLTELNKRGRMDRE